MRLYALSDDHFTPHIRLFDSIKALINAGVDLIQYRSKQGAHDLELLSRICEYARLHKVDFIINDDALLAKEVGASGVHIGKDDGGVLRAREILGGGATIGASCYNDINLALKAQEQGASYVAFGSVFASATKPNAVRCDLSVISKAKELVSVPVCAIGGIDASNIALLKNAGANWAAIVRACYEPCSIEQNIKMLANALKYA